MRYGKKHGAGKPRRAQEGLAIIEYLLLVGVVAIVMFTPSPITHGMAPADYLARAVRSFFRGYSFLISVF